MNDSPARANPLIIIYVNIIISRLPFAREKFSERGTVKRIAGEIVSNVWKRGSSRHLPAKRRRDLNQLPFDPIFSLVKAV